MKDNPCKIVVLIGGNGSNLQALINRANVDLPVHITGVVSHRPDVYGLVRAKDANLDTFVVDHTLFSREVFEKNLIQTIQALAPDLIVMAGFMRILSPLFIQSFSTQILNIHPSLLPKYKGLNTHQRVIDAKETHHGVSVHFVTEELDGGPIVAQVSLPIAPDDNPQTLSTRIHQAEHWLYPQVIGWFAQKRLKYEGNVVTLDGEKLGPQGKQLLLPTQQGIIS